MMALAESDPVKAGSYLTDDFAFTGATPVPVNKTQWIGLQSSMVKAIPDWKFHFTEVRATDHQVTLRAAVTGTHTGVLDAVIPGMQAVPPTGTHISLPSDKLIYTIRDGKIASLHVEASPDGGLPGILQRIGVKFPA